MPQTAVSPIERVKKDFNKRETSSFAPGKGGIQGEGCRRSPEILKTRTRPSRPKGYAQSHTKIRPKERESGSCIEEGELHQEMWKQHRFRLRTSVLRLHPRGGWPLIKGEVFLRKGRLRGELSSKKKTLDKWALLSPPGHNRQRCYKGYREQEKKPRSFIGG